MIEGPAVIDLTDGPAPHMAGVVRTLVFDSHGPRPDSVWLRRFDVRDEPDRLLFQPPVASLGATPPVPSG